MQHANLRCGKRCRAHGVVVSHPFCMRKALGSNPSVSMSISTADLNTGHHAGQRRIAQRRPRAEALKQLFQNFALAINRRVDGLGKVEEGVRLRR